MLQTLARGTSALILDSKRQSIPRRILHITSHAPVVLLQTQVLRRRGGKRVINTLTYNPKRILLLLTVLISTTLSWFTLRSLKRNENRRQFFRGKLIMFPVRLLLQYRILLYTSTITVQHTLAHPTLLLTKFRNPYSVEVQEIGILWSTGKEAILQIILTLQYLHKRHHYQRSIRVRGIFYYNST